MKVTSQSVKLPSKARYLAQIGNYVPSNLHKQVNVDPTASLSSTASKTFGQGMYPKDSKNGTLKNKPANNRTVSFDSAAQLQETLKKNPNRDSEDVLDKENIDNRGKKSSLLSGSSSSVQFSPARNGKRQLQNEEEEKKEEPKKKKERRKKKGNNKSTADPKKSLPGNYDHPEVLYKGVFQNNYMRVDSIGYNDKGVYQIPVRGSYKEYEEQYKMSKRGQSEDLQRETDLTSSQKYLEKRLSLYNLIDVEDLDPLQKDRKKITIMDKISRNEEDIMNPNYLPSNIDFKKLPGNFGNEAVLSDKEKSVIKLQGLVRGMIERKRIAKMKQRVKQHLNGDYEVDPYEIEFYDLNIPIFQQILNINGELPTKKQEKEKTIKAEDPDRKIFSNTFFAALRNTAFPEDPMDYVVLAELQGEEDATFPKLIQEEEKRKSKEVTLVKKYEYLFGKPSVSREIKTDEKSVIGSFLKNNLSSIKDSDLKVGKFQTDYKSKFKPKVQPHAQTTYQTQQQGSPRGRMSSMLAAANARGKKRFDTQIVANKNKDEDINTEISEDYPEDFEESAMKDSIQESIHAGRSMTQSMIKESIMGDARGRDAYMSDSIRESIMEQSSPGKFGQRFSNKSISEEIIGESIRGFNKNSSFKSIQEEIPISESINNSQVKMKKPRKQSEDIEEDIEYKDSYSKEEFESLEEDIQESIEKFQSMRKSSSPSSFTKNNNQSGRKVISPEKIETTKPLFKKTLSRDDEISPIGKFRPSILESRIPETDDRKRNEVPLSRRSEDNDQSFGKEEVRRKIIDPNLIDLPQSNTADILYANFQKELEKLIYVDTLSKKVHSLEGAIDNMYNQKEVNLLHSLQNDARRRFITGSSDVPDPKLEQNTNVYLMQKYNTLERSMATISNQLNYLINNFTGGQIPAAAGGSVDRSQRKPRPIIPITRNQPMKRKEATSVSTTIPQQQQQPQKTVKPIPQQQQQQQQPLSLSKPQPQPLKKQQIVEEIEEEIEIPKQVEQKKPEQKPLVVEPKPMMFKKDESKPKFAFKLPTQMPKEEDADKSFENKENETAINKTPAFEIKKKPEEKKPIIVVEEKPAVVQDQKVNEYKSARFGKWQQESSSSVSEEIVEDLEEEKPLADKVLQKKKSLEEEEDFSAKEYSESFDKSSPGITPKRAFLPPQKFETKKIETPKQETSSVKDYEDESFEEMTPKSSTKKASPVKFDAKKKPEISHDDAEEFGFDEEIDLPSGKSEKAESPVKKTSYSLPPLLEPKKVIKEEPKPVVKEEKEEIKEIKKEVPVEDVPLEESIEDYADDDFEELSLPSEEEKKPVVKPVNIIKEPVQEVKQPAWKNVQENKNQVVESHSDSIDIEASDDLSQISWQDHIFPGEKKEPEPIKKKEPEPIVKKEKKEEPAEDKDKKHVAQLGEIKLKGKYLNPPEHKDINIHQQENPILSPEKKEPQEEISPVEQKHKAHVEKVNKDLGVITDKLKAAKKDQIIRKAINHIKFAAPTEKLMIFDRAPVEDKAIVDAYNEVFLNIFKSELNKLNADPKNSKDVEAKMQIKMGMIISKSKDILLKKITHTNPEPSEDYSKLGRQFSRVYDALKDKRIPNEENEFYEEENDISHLIKDNKTKLKEDVANLVTEALFEEVVRDLMRLSKSKK